MQTRQIIRLARFLRSTHRRTKSWRITSRACKIFTEHGDVNPGLAKRIAKDGYQPSEEVIARLIRDGALEAKKPRTHAPHALFEMRDEDLRSAIQNRRPMPAPTYRRSAMSEFVRACKAASQQRKARAL